LSKGKKVGNTKTSLLITLFSCMSLKRGAYTKAGVNKLRELLAKRHNKVIQRRWAFYCLAAFEAAGLISRRVRIINNSDGTVRQLSSMIAFTVKGAKYLMANKVEGSILLLKQILAWAKGQDKRFPARRETAHPPTLDKDTTDQRRPEDLAKMVFTPI